ncbi:MAG: hypothetical protein ACXW13_07485, partial [Burkholderiaceae bacterium]
MIKLKVNDADRILIVASTAGALGRMGNNAIGDETPAGVLAHTLPKAGLRLLLITPRPVGAPAIAVPVGNPSIGGETPLPIALAFTQLRQIDVTQPS